MRAEIEAADRRREVRLAARSWKQRGVVEPDTLVQIEKAYSDDRSRIGPVFRRLLFVFAGVAVLSAFGILALAKVPWGVLFLLMSFACLMATELQMGGFERWRSGAEEATSFLAVVFLLAAAAWWMFDGTWSNLDFPWRGWCAVAAVAWALAAFRWASWPYGAFFAAALLSTSAFLPWTRLYWIVTAVVFVPLLLSLSLSPRSAPSHRRVCDAAMLVLLTAVYLTIHLGIYDSQLLEGHGQLFGHGGLKVPLPNRWIFVAGTALMPILLLGAGIHWRLPIFFRTAVVFGVASLVTLRFYVHVAPLWVILTVSGAAALVIAFVLRRYLASGPGGERQGFTAEPLYENRSQADAIEMGLAAALVPGAPEKPDSSSFPGDGGEFGGGGAGRKF